MVSTPGDVEGASVFKGVQGALKRFPARYVFPDYKPFVDRKPDSPYFRGRQRHAVHLSHHSRVCVRRLSPPTADRDETNPTCAGYPPEQLLGQQFVLDHGEAVSFGKFVAIDGRVERLRASVLS
jgi:hypothetical protein